MVFPDALKVTVLREAAGQENFVLVVSRHREVCHSFENLRNEIVARCPGLLQSDEIKFFWIDDEGDEITIINHGDYFDYMDSCNQNGQKRRIYAKGLARPSSQTATVSFEETPIEEVSEAKVEQSAAESLPDNLPVHSNIVCDVCDAIIKGHRYKCMQCFNYDLCMRCESRYRHKDHMMIRIPTPAADRRAPFRLFEKLRSYVADVGAPVTPPATAHTRDDDYENCKRSKRHHRRNSKDREESRERREEKERKERKHRRERSAKCAEERRGGRHGHGHHFNFSHLINQVIDPANISAFLSADAAAAAAAAAAESAQEAARASMANCPLFTSTTSTSNAGTTFVTSASASASTTAPNATHVSTENSEEASAPSPTSEEPQAKKAATSSTPMDQETRQQRDFDLSWLAPTPESIQKINQTFSKILDPLGMNIEIRSNGTAAKPAQTQTPTEEKKDKTTETANTPTTSTPSQTSPVVTAVTSNKSTEIDPIAELEQKLQAAFLAEALGQKSQAIEADLTHSDDDDDSSVSSVSLLSDNEGTTEHGETAEKKWTLVDLPCDEEQVYTKQPEAMSAAAKSDAAIKAETVSTVQQETSALATPLSVPEATSASSASHQPVKQIDYEQLGKALKQHLKAEKKAATASQPPSKETTPPPMVSTSPVSLPTRTAIPLPPPPTQPQPIHTAIPLPPASTAGPQQASPSKIVYSSRPHVNHAIHAMMAMGFSNEGGWLAQLLESVHGDIPRALDMLTPHKINP
ncbi:protein ref(2)P [Wyeomyia smithii]|uniref:protein ref(2)P n=1 Tax=Wyeomyia smithii TaxID=174621 RepID=UPI002467E047|nr:protein ref(2)P [Wyeomyia smithii]